MKIDRHYVKLFAASLILLFLLFGIATCYGQDSRYAQIHDNINVAAKYYTESTTMSTIGIICGAIGTSMMVGGIVGNSLQNDTGLACYLHHGGDIRNFKQDHPVSSGFLTCGTLLNGFAIGIGTASIVYKFKGNKALRAGDVLRNDR